MRSPRGDMLPTGGYHLVWTRDMINTAMGLLAAGNTSTPLRALIYVAASQQGDGGFSQNFRIDGEPYGKGIQLDEVSFPILLAWRSKEDDGLGEFDPDPMVVRAASFLIRHGPATAQERWEGQRDDGGPYQGWGRSRAWPLLTGERAHYELALGRDVEPLIRALEGLASPTGLLPEQVWDQPDQPDIPIRLGQPTGAAMPLMWAHAEYIKLLRSVRDGKVFDEIPEVAARYQPGGRKCRALEMWKPNRQPRTVARGHTFRIQAPAAFRLRWTRDEWQSATDTVSSPTALGIEFVDIPIPIDQRAPIRFTFLWTLEDRWEGRDYEVATIGEPR